MRDRRIFEMAYEKDFEKSLKYLENVEKLSKKQGQKNLTRFVFSNKIK